MFPAWQCAKCGWKKPGTVHQLRQTYCSKACMAAAYSQLMRGDKNPNFRALVRICKGCGGNVESYQRKFCSDACRLATGDRRRAEKERQKAAARKPRPVVVRPVKPPKPPKPEPTYRGCVRCGIEFRVYPSSKQVFCSYQCHLDSGGARRAGIAAAQATMRYGAKKDANHKEIMEEMRKYCPVYDMSHAGFGIPDGAAWIGNNTWQFFDIKNPKTGYGKRGLNPVQKKWLENRKGGGPIFLIYTLEEAKKFAQGELDGLKFEVGNTEQMNCV